MNARLFAATITLILLALALPQTGLSQGKPPPPVKPNPAAPVLNFNGVLTAQRGTTVTLTLNGTGLADPTGLMLDFPAKVTFPSDANNGKDNAKLRVVVEIPKDAPMGVHGLRLATAKGMSNLRLFAVDELPQALKADSAKVKATPQEITAPGSVVGKIENESSDWYKINVKAGQRLSFDVIGRRLGGPIDPELTIYHAKTGKELAHENDAPGCQNDPRLTFTFKEEGAYLIEIKDVTNRGGADYGYLLRVGDFPCVTTPLPLAVKRGTKASLQFSGPHVEGVAPVEVDAPTDRAITTLWIAPKGANGLHGWPVAVALSNLDELLEQEPNNEAAKANRVAVPGGITGRLQPGDDRDFFVFAGKKGQKLVIEVQTLELYSPTLVYMILRNAKGAELGKSNPNAVPPADQRIEFTPAEDGDINVEVQHLNLIGGPSEVYRLTITPDDPGFDVVAGLDRWDAAVGSKLAIPLTVNRKGYTGPIDVEVLGSMGFSGKSTIAAGQAFGTFPLEIADDVKIGGYAFALQARIKAGDKELTQLIGVRPHISGSLNALPFPPRELNTRLAIAVRQAPPFTLAVDNAGLKLKLGGMAKLKITAARRDYDGPIALEIKNLPANVKAAKATLDKGQDNVEVELTATDKAPLGPKADIQVTGTANGLQFTTPPFAINVEKK